MGADVGIGYPPDVTRELTQAVNQKVDPARLNHVAGIDKDYPVRILESTRPDWLRLLPKSPTRLEILFDKDTNIRAVLAPGDKGLQDVTTNCPNELKTAMVKAARAAIRGQPESPLDNWTSPSEKYGASGMTLVEADALELPFAEGSLDFIWNFNVLQHYWSFEKGAIFEDFALRLKEGGIALVGMGGKEGPGPRLSWTVYRKTKGTLLPREIFFHPLAFLRTSDRVLNAWTRRFRKDILSGSMESNPETLVKRLRELGYPAEVRKGGMISLVLRPDGKAVNIRSLPLSTSLEWLDSTGSAA